MLWVMYGMTQRQTKINGPYSDILLRKTMNDVKGFADWPCVLGAFDNPPGGVWIDFIRRTVEDSQSIVAVPVTGSLVSPTLFSCRDANCTYIF